MTESDKDFVERMGNYKGDRVPFDWDRLLALARRAVKDEDMLLRTLDHIENDLFYEEVVAHLNGEDS